MEFQEVVRSRRMVRSFEDRPLGSETVERVVSNALRAPSAGLTQGSSFVVLQGPQETQRYWSASFPTSEARQSFHWPGLLRAPVIIVVLADEQAYVDRYAEADKSRRDGDQWPAPWWYVDGAFAALLMLLTAVDEELGALFFGVQRPAEVKAALGIPERYATVGTVAVGYPASDDRPSKSVSRPRRSVDEVVHRGGW